MSRTKLYLAMPTYGGIMCNLTMTCILRLQVCCMQNSVEIMLDCIGNESLIQRARNMLTARFLRSDATHLMFIDADIGFDPESVMRLLRADRDIASAIYPKKNINWDLVEKKQKDPANKEPISQAGLDFNINLLAQETPIENGWVKVLDAATGFMMIKRSAMETIVEAHRHDLFCVNDLKGPHDNIENYIAVWDCMIDPVTKRYLSEDYSFNRRAQALGIDTHACVLTPLIHVGNQLFEGDINYRLSSGIVEIVDEKKGENKSEKTSAESDRDTAKAPEDPDKPEKDRQSLLAVISENGKESCTSFLWSLLLLQVELIRHQHHASVVFFQDVNTAMHAAHSEGFESLAILNGMVPFNVKFVMDALMSPRDFIVGVMPLPKLDWERLGSVPADDPEPVKYRGLHYNVSLQPASRIRHQYLEVEEIKWMPTFVIRQIVLQSMAPRMKHSKGHLFWAEDVSGGELRTKETRFVQEWGRPVYADIINQHPSFGHTEFAGVVGHRTTIR